MAPSGICCTTAAFFALLVFAPPMLPAGGQAITWHEPVRVASGDAHVGPWRMNDSAFHYVDDPTVAINNQRSIAVTWADQARQDIFFRRFNENDQATEPINVSRSPDIFSWLPRMVITDDDPAHVYVLWQEIVFSGGTHGGEAFFARSTDGGRTFDEPINLSNSIAGDGKGRLTRAHWHNGSLDLIRGPAGNLYAAWTEYEGRLWLSRSDNRGKNFMEPLHVAGDDDTPARGPSLAVGNDGTVYLTWSVGEDSAADIHYTTSKDQGKSFSDPEIIHKNDSHADAPKIAVDSKDRIHLVYAEGPVDGQSTGHRIRYARSDDGATFSEAKEISLSRDNTGAAFPALDLDGEDNLYVLWEVFPQETRGRSRGLKLTQSTDGGQTFMRPETVPGTADPELGINGSLQGLLMRKLAINESDTIAVVNSTFKRDEASHVWLTRGRSTR